MPKFRKKPVVIEAMQFETNNENGCPQMDAVCIWANQGRPPEECYTWHNGTNIFVKTLEGVMRADVGDWIIRGVKGELYPCKQEIFAATYEACDTVLPADRPAGWFSRLQAPTMPGVYCVTRGGPIAGLGSSYAHWDGQKWGRHKNWGDYTGSSDMVWRGEGPEFLTPFSAER